MKMKIHHHLLVVSVVLFSFDGQFCGGSGLGRCPKHEFMADFNVSMFTGRWYEVERSFYLMELASSCITIDLKKNKKNQIEVALRMRSRWSGSIKVSEGIAVPSKKGPGYFQYKINSYLPNIFSRYLPGTGYYQILNTDYDTYAVIWTCSNFGLAHTDFIWIWGRERELNVTLRADIYSFLSARLIDSERLVLPNNYNCDD